MSLSVSYCDSDLNQNSTFGRSTKETVCYLKQTIIIINTFQNDRKLQTLNKDQQILTADQNKLLLDHGKLEQKAQVT